MTKYLWHDGRWVEAVRTPRVSVFPAIHRDYMEPATHPGDGKTTDSKSVFRRATKAAGMVELGTDAPKARVKPQTKAVSKADIAQAWDMVAQGYRPEAPAPIDMETRLIG